MKKNRAFTLIELLVVIAIIALLVGILLPALGKARASARQLKDATQIRNVVQAMVVFAQNNNDSYPLPSKLDASNTTINNHGTDISKKDNTGNILSILIFQGAVSTELAINPAESNTAVVVRDDKYQFADPVAATAYSGTSTLALWDPGFSGSAYAQEAGGGQRRNSAGIMAADPTTRVSHQSYAHNPPFGKRLNKWQNTFTTTEAVFGNRGPSYVETLYPASGRYTLNPAGHARPGVDSNTLLIHGGRNSWSGNIGYNDSHVSFETKPNPDGITYRRRTGTPLTVLDCLFIDETDEAGPMGGTNEFSTFRSNNILKVVANPTSALAEGSVFWYD
jgi:prepilin-type N-terminal cleavage/methylation domain-containing protein